MTLTSKLPPGAAPYDPLTDACEPAAYGNVTPVAIGRSRPAWPAAHARPDNRILAALPADEYEQIERHLEAHPLKPRMTIEEAGDRPDFVYFPTSGIISVLTVLENGMTIECATVGREGTSGVPLFLGCGITNTALVSLLPGSALRMKRKDFLAATGAAPAFAAALARYAGVMLSIVAQSAACNRAHSVDQRCARWLLVTHDEAEGNQFPITQEFLAQVLGVSRPSVALTAATFQSDGLIRYHRGEMTIANRAGLEEAACECYGVVRANLNAGRLGRAPTEEPASTSRTDRVATLQPAVVCGPSARITLRRGSPDPSEPPEPVPSALP